MDDFKYGGTNFSAYRMIDVDKPEVKMTIIMRIVIIRIVITIKKSLSLETENNLRDWMSVDNAGKLKYFLRSAM